MLLKLFKFVYFFVFFQFAPNLVSAEVIISVVGDSLVSGYGLEFSDSFPYKLETALNTFRKNITVKNAGVSGDTSAGGLARLPWVLEENPDIVVIVLGSNDMLRGIAPLETKKNLTEIVKIIRSKKIGIVFCGMKASLNLGKEYTREFNKIYPEIAKENNLIFFPFFLDMVALNKSLNQSDLIHPNVKGVEVIVKNIIPSIDLAINEHIAKLNK